MGADAYSYYTAYDEDYNKALEELKMEEFKAGRYHSFLEPGEVHSSIQEAIDLAMEDGTCSILDLQKVSSECCRGMAYLLNKEDLLRFFQTEQPTRELIEERVDDFWDELSAKESLRGYGICIPVYKNDMPDELFFMGFSWD